jgi:hypothetical protein
MEKTQKLNLAPLSFSEAVRDILKVRPEHKAPNRPKTKKQGNEQLKWKAPDGVIA